MAKITYIKRRHRRRRFLSSIATRNAQGQSAGVTTATGRFGMIGTAVGIATANADDNIAHGTSTGTSTASGIINAASTVGTATGFTLAQAAFDSDNSIGESIGVTTVVGRPGATGTAVGITRIDTAYATTEVDSLADQVGFENRIKSLLPPSWFADSEETVLDIPVSGMSYGLLWIYVLYLYVLQQSRITTASGVWLDRIAYDFFGSSLPRLLSESDADYSLRIRAAIVAQKQTRASIISSLEFLTGNAPKITELWNPGDVGCYNTTASNGIATQGYGVAGMWGSLKFNNQFLVTAYRPSGEGVPGIPGYGIVSWGYASQAKGVDNEGGGEYCDLDQIIGRVLDSDIYANIASMIGAGNTAWTVILTKPDIIDAPMAYFGSVDNSAVAAIATSFF